MKCTPKVRQKTFEVHFKLVRVTVSKRKNKISYLLITNVGKKAAYQKLRNVNVA